MNNFALKLLILRKLNYILPTLTLILGLVLGYIIGGSRLVDSNMSNASNNNVTESVMVVHDTVVKQKIIEVQPVEVINFQDTLLLDSILTDSARLDTVSESYIEKYKDTLTDDKVTIRTDKVIASKKVNIIYVDDSNIDKDSTIKELLSIKEIHNKSIIIEFWESPLNYIGYKLSKSKLVVYGLSPQLDATIFKTKTYYILETENIFYELNETADFAPLVQVDKPIFLND